MMINDYTPDGGHQLYYGMYPAIVTNLVDEKNLGRIEVKFPWLGTEGEKNVRAWATLLSPYADDDQGFQVLPEKDSQVVVAFEAGNLRRPYIVGACWNGQEALPVSPEEANNKRVIKTRSKSILEFDDTKGKAKVTLSTDSGHKLVLDDSSREVTLTHKNGCVIKFNSGGSIEIRANATVDLTAPAFNVTAETSTFSGIINCKSVITNTCASSPMYTPGMGNLW